MRAVVLVGGEGTRLRPLTLTRPKQMLPVIGMTMLEHVLRGLASHGVEEAVLSLGYKPDAFLRAFPDGRAAGVRLRYAVEATPLDTAGAIRFAAWEAGFDEERVIVVNGDILTDLDVGALVRFHEASGAEATLSLHQVADPSAFGVVTTANDGRVLEFVEKPKRADAPTDWINAGTYVLEPEALARIPLNERVSIERVTFPQIAADGRLYGFAWKGQWVDAGTPATYRTSQLELLSAASESGASWFGPGSIVDGTVEGSIVGALGRIAPGARVDDSVLLPHCVVGTKARVTRSVLGQGVVVGDGASVVDTVLGDGVVVAAGECLEGVSQPA